MEAPKKYVNFSVTTVRNNYCPRKPTSKEKYFRICVIPVILHGLRWRNIFNINGKDKTDNATSSDVLITDSNTFRT